MTRSLPLLFLIVPEFCICSLSADSCPADTLDGDAHSLLALDLSFFEEMAAGGEALALDETYAMEGFVSPVNVSVAPAPAPLSAGRANTSLNLSLLPSTPTPYVPPPLPLENATTATPAPAPYANVTTTKGPKVGPGVNVTSSMNATRLNASYDCIVSDWTEWSDCLRLEQGMGQLHRVRLRAVVQPRRGNGTHCPYMTESDGCNSADDNDNDVDDKDLEGNKLSDVGIHRA